MKFSEIIHQARTLLREKGRITPGALKREFDLDEDAFEDLKNELVKGERVARESDGLLVWIGNSPRELASNADSADERDPSPPGERRQLTVMFCDLVASTSLSERLDPEDLQNVVLAYQRVCAAAIDHYDGYIAQYLGDGLLIYFGYPTAHDDDAARATRAGLGVIAALHDARDRFPTPIQVRIGIHTGPVVVGEMGGGTRQESLALGRTPNIAARIQGCAEPDTVLISAATRQLVAGLFETKDCGAHELKGIASPQVLYSVTAESAQQSRFDVAVRSGLTPLVGRDFELRILQERWRQAQEGNGQVVLLSGEPGIGKSRLVEELKAHVAKDSARRIEFRCSPYHQNSALYPVIDHLERLLQFAPHDPPNTKFQKLRTQLTHFRFPRADTLALMAALLSLPHPEGVPPLNVSPQKQKDLTQAALAAWLVEETEQTAIFSVWEDLHWADPSTLELLTLLLSQVPTSQLLLVLTFRPEFAPPWTTHSYISHVTLSRLGHSQVNAMVGKVTGGRSLPDEVVQQVVARTDGVPLFVEELTKMVVESGLVRVAGDHYELAGALPPLGIPSTLQDSLMARLDRLGTVRETAQLGATLGREFDYPVLAAASPLPEKDLQLSLQQLVESELVHQRGLPPHARYVFKHALIRDTAYESILKSRRHHLHQQVAQVLESELPSTVAIQPELLAHHYTEAGLGERAIPYWQQAGERALQRSAVQEAINHLKLGLNLLEAVPESTASAKQELSLQMALAAAETVRKGFAAPEAGAAYSRANEICRGLGDRPEVVDVLLGLWAFHVSGQSKLNTSREIAEQLLQRAERAKDPLALLKAHIVMCCSMFYQGEFLDVGDHVDACLDLYDLEAHHELFVSTYGYDRGIITHCWKGMTRWMLGYPDQAKASSEAAVALAQDRAHPYTLAVALVYASWIDGWRGDFAVARDHAAAGRSLSDEHGFALTQVWGTTSYHAALAGLGECSGEGEAAQAVDRYRGAGVALWMPHVLGQLASIECEAGRVDEALRCVKEGLELSSRRGDRCFEAELHRLHGQMAFREGAENEAQPEAEGCFGRALDAARTQGAKSIELRAATSLARLWGGQGHAAKARKLLEPIYGWFGEGFETRDLAEARSVLHRLR